MTLEEAIQKVGAAKVAADLLGPIGLGRKKLQIEYTLALHPDKHDGDQAARASAAFAQFRRLLDDEAKASVISFDVTTKTRTYMVKELAFKGTVSNLYNCTYSRDDALKRGLLKLPRSVRDSDLTTNEARTLKKIWESGAKRRIYFPRFEESFKHRDKATGKDRRGLVIRRLPGFISLGEVLEAFPEGIDARDLAWIWRRCLAALSLLNELDIVHGAIAPEHILMHPVQHGVMLCGFSASVETGEKVQVLGTKRTSIAPEILAKQPVSNVTDLFMLHVAMQRLLRTDAPSQYQAFIKACTAVRPAVRPQDPRQVLGHLDSLLERLYGPRKFRVFPDLPGWSE